MHIALVWPTSKLVDPMWYPPLGLWYVWSALEKSGHTCEFFDLAENELIEVMDDGFDAWFVSGTTPQAQEIREIGDFLRKCKAKAYLGGPHAWLAGEEMLQHYNVVVTGEVLPETVPAVLAAEGLFAPRRSPDLATLPIPNRSAAQRYHASLDGRRCTSIITSLGCPYKCAFCTAQWLWDKVRYIPTDTVAWDIHNCYMTGFGAIQVYDDIFPVRKGRALTIAATMCHYGMKWRCFLRSDLAVHHGFDFLETLREDGLCEVLVGVESGSDAIKAKINKGTTAAQDAQVRKWCRDLGISYKASIILGLPGETKETLEETRNWLLTNRPDRVDLNTLIPIPGTPLYEKKEEYDCYWVGGSEIAETYFKTTEGDLTCAVGTANLTPEEILTFRNKLQAELGVPY